MIEINIQNKGDYPLDEKKLHNAVVAVSQMHQRIQGHTLSIVVDDDVAVAALNEAYRGIAAPTDVLSFPADPMPEEIADAEDGIYLGDLVIAYPYTKAQAIRDGYNLNDTLGLLVVHGTLHLLGYDHDTPENRAVMWQAQARALDEVGISPDIVPALEADTHGDHS